MQSSQYTGSELSVEKNTLINYYYSVIIQLIPLTWDRNIHNGNKNINELPTGS